MRVSNTNGRFSFPVGFACAVLAACACAPVARAADAPTPAFNGKDLSGWKTRDPKSPAAWKVAADAKPDAQDPKKLVAAGEPAAGQAAVVLEKSGPGGDLVTEREFGDCEVHVEFMVPKGSNSGVYLMGRYEVQVLDSFGKKDADLKPGDVGGIYQAAAPKANHAKPPGEWQSFHIVFRAPRFGPDGKKTENATFVMVKLNGQTIHENVAVKGPTGGELPGGEKPTGPLMLQGDHGPVAYRNLTIKPTAIRGGAAEK